MTLTPDPQRLARERRERYVAWQAAMQAYRENLTPQQLREEQEATQKKEAAKLKKVARIIFIHVVSEPKNKSFWIQVWKLI